MRTVLDTNVLASGLLNAYGPPGRIVDFTLAGVVQIVYDDWIMGKYEAVLARPKFNFPSQKVKDLLGYIRLSGLVVSAPLLPFGLERLDDPNDLPFAEVAVAANVKVLVMGNKKRFDFLSNLAVVSVQTLAEFVAMLSSEKSGPGYHYTSSSPSLSLSPHANSTLRR